MLEGKWLDGSHFRDWSK